MYAPAPAAAYAPAPYGTYAPAPAAGYAPAPYGTYAPAPAAGYAPAPAAGSVYGMGYYGYYNYSSSGAAAPPALAGAPGAAGSAPAPLPGAKLVDPAARQAIVDQLVRTNANLTLAKVTEDLRSSQLTSEANSLYASKLGVSVDALSDVDRSDAKNLLAAATGAAPATPTAPATATTPAAAAGTSSGGWYAPAPSVMPVVPVYGKPVHPWIYSHPWIYTHPRLYNILAG